VLGLGDLASQGVCRVALTFPHESGRAHAGLPLRGGGPGGDESSGEVEVRSRQTGGRSRSQDTLRQQLEEGLQLGMMGLRLEEGLRLLEARLEEGLRLLEAPLGDPGVLSHLRARSCSSGEDKSRCGCSRSGSRGRRDRPL
jgi:hypothetical protein